MTRALLPLTPLYAAAVAAKNLAYTRGWAHPQRLQSPVISIGNLSTGGSGKTPLTIRLAELLRDHGIAVDVLSRGYGRTSQQVQRVDPAGSADQYGDEPILIARSTSVPVYVSASRYAAGQLAERELSSPENPGPRLHLLDDGFQHRRLARNLDIVVLHRNDFSAHLLPSGNLREPFTSLSRAQILALREEDRDLEPQLRARGFHQPILWMTRTLAVPNGGQDTITSAVAFSAIAHPVEFLAALRKAGLRIAASRSWRDHHRFTAADIADLLVIQRQYPTAAFVTTEKDWVRLAPDHRGSLESAAPLHAAQLTVRLADEPAVIQQILALAMR
jgi:tetraacyldisaccharide 4'-kinase